MAMLGPTVAAAAHTLLLADSLAAQTAYYVSKVVLALLPVIWLLLIAQQRPAWPRLVRRGLLGGVVSGLLAVLAIVIVYRLLPSGLLDASVLQDKARLLGVTDHFLWFGLFVAVVNSALEEYYWRWFVFGRLRTWWGVTGSVLLSAVAFGMHHFLLLWTWFGSAGLAFALTIGVAVAGAFWAFWYERTANWYAIWISHALADLGVLLVGADLLLSG